MRIISRKDLTDDTAAVLDAVDAGETFHITRDGLAIAELRPASRRARFTAEELVERHHRLPRVDRDVLRREADSLLGTDGV